MSDDEFYDAQSSPSDSDHSIDSIDLDFRDQRLKQMEKMHQRELQMKTVDQPDPTKLQDVISNHQQILQFRETIDTAADTERDCLSGLAQEEESETDTKGAKPKMLANFNDSKFEEEFINPLDRQILYQISGNHVGTSGSDCFNSESDLTRDDISLNESDMHQTLDESDQMECKSLSDHVIIRKSFDTTSVKLNNELKISAKPTTKTNRLRRVINKFVRSKKQDNNSSESEDSESDLVPNINESAKMVKYKSSAHHLNDFERTHIIQILSCESNSNTRSIIWSIKFSPCGKLLATAGKDKTLRIWILKSCLEQFVELMRKSNNNEICSRVSALLAINSPEPFVPYPFMTYDGHTEDILDISWSKNLFILTASSDKTCRLWHVYKTDCLCVFNHQSIVSSINFHPKDDRYFISACLDCKLRLWNISDKVVVLCNDINSLNRSSSNFITAINFCQNGKLIAVGTFDGKCILYHTEHLKYYSLINVRSTRGRNSKGSKITGIENLNNDENKILITSNDSRIRLYDLRDLSLVCKYKGFANSTVHIKASLSPDDRFILCGSKNKRVYIWRTNQHISVITSGRRDRNKNWERIQAHNAIVTCAVFAPKPNLIVADNDAKLTKNFHVFASVAGCDGVIKIFQSK